MTVGLALPDDDEDEESEDEEGEEVNKEDEGEKAEEVNRDFWSLQAERDDSNRDQLQTIEDEVARLNIGDTETLEPPSFNKICEELMRNAYYRQSLFNSHYILNDLRGVASLLDTYKRITRSSSGETRVVLTVSPWP